MTNVFSWVVTYGNGFRDTTHKVGPNEDVRDLSEGDYDAPI